MFKRKLNRWLVPCAVGALTLGTTFAAGEDPSGAVITAMTAGESSGKLLIAAAGAILVGMAIMGALWAVGANWGSKAIKGGK